jgi:DNA-binding transcriptional ArsR family regulator
MAATKGGWRIGRSIASELDVAIFLSQVVPREGLGATDEGYHHEVLEFIRSIPQEWIAELGPWTTSSPSDWLSVMEYVARWSDVLYTEDYEEASGAMRALTVDEATTRLVGEATPYDIKLDDSQEPIPALAALAGALDERLMTEIELHQPEGGIKPLGRAAHIAAETLVGGALHERFWHWVDRLYYGLYKNWRDTRLNYMATEEARVERLLGGKTGEDSPPLDWLPTQNTISTLPKLRELVESGTIEVVFWVEPFELSDTWTMLPGSLKLTFAEPGALSRGFDAILNDLASVMKALADPTRLRILKMIRHYDLDNTQVATYLGIARPTVSVHTRVLRDAGLITTVREGRQARHSLNPDVLQHVYTSLGGILDVEDV